jgi:hypothetical protein
MSDHSIGDVGRLGDEWGFTLFDGAERELAEFLYPTEDEARQAQKAMRLVVEPASEIGIVPYEEDSDAQDFDYQIVLIGNPWGREKISVADYTESGMAEWVSDDQRAKAISTGRLVEGRLEIAGRDGDTTYWGADLDAVTDACAEQYRSVRGG